MINDDVRWHAERIFAQMISGWMASGREPFPDNGHHEAEMALRYAREFDKVLREQKQG